MNDEIVKELENIINQLDRSESDLKQFSLRIRKIDEEIKKMREFRDSLKLKRSETLENAKVLAISLERIDKEYKRVVKK